MPVRGPAERVPSRLSTARALQTVTGEQRQRSDSSRTVGILVMLRARRWLMISFNRPSTVEENV
jgi:hypothetical protein